MDRTHRRAIDHTFMRRRAFCALLLALPVFAISCGGSHKAAEPVADAKVGQHATSAAPITTIREISEDELVRYIDALKELRHLGAATDAKLGNDPSRMQTMFTGMEATGKFEEILSRHGFSHDSFMQVHYNVVQTYAAISIDERGKEIEESRAKQAAALEQMKGKLPPEQLEAMRRATEQGNQMVETSRNVPATNKELLNQHREQFLAAVEK